VGSVLVVVIGVLAQDVMQMRLAEDQEPVGALAADGSDPPLGDDVRLWRLDRCIDDSDPDRGEDRIKGRRELGEQVTGLLGSQGFLYTTSQIPNL
jgi:hypothetical protein